MANKWITFVKNYAKEHNMKYSDCLKNGKCKAAYKKGEGFSDLVKTAVNSNIGKAVFNKGVEMGSDYFF
jgi:hypothetical protein